MSASHGYSTMAGIEYGDGGNIEKTKRRKSHIDEANQWAMEMPIHWCQCKECNVTDALSYKCMKAQK